MAGIYLHIPFCRKACVYCDFHFSTQLAQRPQMVEAMLKELELCRDYLKGENIDSIYFGGGTPSVLEEGEVAAFLEACAKHYKLSSTMEITLEANPDDLKREKLQALRAAGVNRLSIGIQSFDETDLKWMNRSHSAGQGKAAVRDAQDLGFNNISIDLIYGLPKQDLPAWRANMQQAIELEVQHISAYSLTVEEKTALGKWNEKGKVQLPDEETYAIFFHALSDLMEAGYEHYELSNLAKPGYRAVHNSNYWNSISYLGIGPSAHSFRGRERSWNVANNALYMKAIQKGDDFSDGEELRLADQFNERIMTSLRKIEGLDLAALKADFEEKWTDYLFGEAQPELDRGNLIRNRDRLYIPQDRRFFTDGIAAALFYI